MQVILDSSFERPGSAPIWDGKKGEFRDWTRVHCPIFVKFTKSFQFAQIAQTSAVIMTVHLSQN